MSRLGILLAALAALAAQPTAATRPQGIAYEMRVSGLRIGTAELSAAVDGGRYAVEGRADFRFLFWGGAGDARSEGAVEGGRLRPDRFRLGYVGVRRPGATEIDFERGRAVRWASEPPPPEDYLARRTPVESRHLADVIDPLAALVAPLASDADPDAVCARVAPVFSGWTRFDLVLAGAAATEDGAVTCETRYRAVAGHVPDSAGVARLQRPGALSVSLAPIGDGLWGPERVVVETRLGPFELRRVAE